LNDTEFKSRLFRKRLFCHRIVNRCCFAKSF